MTLAERTGVLVLRIWIESGTGGLRARITAEPELGSGERVTTAAGTVDEIVASVRGFVEEFLTRAVADD